MSQNTMHFLLHLRLGRLEADQEFHNILPGNKSMESQVRKFNFSTPLTLNQPFGIYYTKATTAQLINKLH